MYPFYLRAIHIYSTYIHMYIYTHACIHIYSVGWNILSVDKMPTNWVKSLGFLAILTMKITIFWNMTTYNPVESHRRFGAIYSLYLAECD
jgi:hypothetical protein